MKLQKISFNLDDQNAIDKMFIETYVLKEDPNFRNKTKNWETYVKNFLTYASVKTQSDDVKKHFNIKVLHPFFENQITISNAYNIILEDIKSRRKK